MAALASVPSGCMTYRPMPLVDSHLEHVLAPPTREQLIGEAAHFTHPRLAPITLDFSIPLTGRELGVIAVLVNPELKALREREKVAAAQVFAAGLLPDPQLAGGLDSPIGAPPGTTGLVDAYNVALSWAVLAVVTRPAELRVARASAEQVRSDVAWQEWLVANRTRLLARRVDFLRRQEALARASARVTGHLLDLTRRNLDAGDATITEFGVREVAFLDAQDRALALARLLEATRQDLNRILGLPPADGVEVASAPIAMATPFNAIELFARARAQRLDLAALRAGYASQEARVYRAVLGQYPSFGLGVGRNRDTAGVVTIGFSVTLDLPILSRNRGGLAVTEATRDQLYEEYVNRLHQTRADIATLVADLGRIAREHRALESELPGLRRAEEALRRAVDTGDATLLEYETVRAALLDKDLKLLTLEQAAAEQHVALEIAVGESLTP